VCSSDLTPGGRIVGDYTLGVDQESQGYTLLRHFAFEIDPVTGASTATYLGSTAGPYMKSLSEGHAASMAFLNNGSDAVAGQGIPGAVFAAADPGFSLFSSLSYGSSRYETGSHVDVSGLSLILGGAYGIDASIGRFTIGAFFEYGNGTYDSYNDFPGGRSINGSGDTEYVGGGILTRLDFAQSDSGFTYAEFSARVGRVSVDFASADLGPLYRYDLDSTYYGLHLGVGHVFNITDSTTLDLYGKWLFTHQGGKDAIIDGDRVHFDDVNSHRLRAGIKVATEINEWVKPYFGAAYEHELDGKAEATVEGHRVDVPELKGGSGIGELGLSISAAEQITLDIGVQGYVGTRRGISGSLSFTYNF
jgi:outer membrane autotransporter protein